MVKLVPESFADRVKQNYYAEGNMRSSRPQCPPEVWNMHFLIFLSTHWVTTSNDKDITTGLSLCNLNGDLVCVELICLNFALLYGVVLQSCNFDFKIKA